jgi:hypothetical protein
MSSAGLVIVIGVLTAALLWVWWLLRRARQVEYIRSYMFPPGLFEKLRAKRPDLGLKECQLAARGLRQFFLAHLKSGCRFVSMPSQVVDDLWHEFILYTRHYEAFCRTAFRGFLHHTPAVVLSERRRDNEGLRRTWWYACLEENINPRHATRLPLLFALDAKLNIADGFRYAPDCAALREKREETGSGGDGAVYCGGDFSSSDFDGTTDGFGDSSSGDGGGGGCGGGCRGGD